MKKVDSLALVDSAQSHGAESTADDAHRTLWRLALAFFKIGALGFGGGMAILPLLERDCVQRHHCIRAKQFMHGVGLGQILGPFAVNVAIFIGYSMFGVLGGLIAAVSFLAPSVLMVILLSWLYFTFHKIPSLGAALTGLGPVVIGLILSTAWSMGRKSLATPAGIILAVASCALSLVHVNATWILAGAAFAGVALKLSKPFSGRAEKSDESSRLKAFIPVSFPGVLPVHKAVAAKGTGSAAIFFQKALFAVALLPLLSLAWVFLKMGMVFFGGGFVLIPILFHKLVLGLGWLTQKEFLDGVAISQLTPGPVAVLATFVGYKVAGVSGALIATAALFAPAMALMFVISHFYEKMAGLTAVQDLLAGITPTVVGLVVAAAILLAPGSLHPAKPVGWLLTAVAFFLTVRLKWHPAFVLVLGVATGLLAPGLI